MRQRLSYTAAMAATHETRIVRLKRLEALLAPGRAGDACPDGARLLAILGEDYADRTRPGLWDAIAEWRTQTAFDWPDLTPQKVDGWRDPSPGRVFDWTD